MMRQMRSNPLVNKRYRRIRSLSRKMQRDPYTTKECELEIQRQYKLMPRFLYESQIINVHGVPKRQPAIKIEREEGKIEYIPLSKYREMLANGEISVE